MRFVSLNIRHGGGTRSPNILAWLDTQSADLVLLTEWRANTNGLRIKAAIEDKGYTSVGESGGPSSNGLLIASNGPFTTLNLTPVNSPKGEILAADLDDGLRILCCYFPGLEAKKPFFDVCLEQAITSATPLLIVGDLNTGRNDVDLEEGAAKFFCSDQFIELTNRAEMTDLWRHSNGSTAREWTWRSPKNGFRLDHAFGNRALISSYSSLRCRYDHSTRESGLTDHSAIVLDFDAR